MSTSASRLIKDLAFDIDSPLLDLNLLYPGICVPSLAEYWNSGSGEDSVR